MYGQYGSFFSALKSILPLQFTTRKILFPGGQKPFFPAEKWSAWQRTIAKITDIHKRPSHPPAKIVSTKKKSPPPPPVPLPTSGRSRVRERERKGRSTAGAPLPPPGWGRIWEGGEPLPPSPRLPLAGSGREANHRCRHRSSPLSPRPDLGGSQAAPSITVAVAVCCPDLRLAGAAADPAPLRRVWIPLPLLVASRWFPRRLSL